MRQPAASSSHAASSEVTGPRPRRGWPLAGLPSLGLTAVLGAGLWFWSGTEGSLETTVRAASALLPAGLSLQTQGVQGSLRQGGRIEALHWQQEGLELTLQQVELQLEAHRLWQGQLPLHTLRVGMLHGSSTSATTSSPAPTQWVWPLSVQLDWRLDQLHWRGPATVEAADLQGQYRFDGEEHLLQLGHLRWASSQYQGQLRLQARAPMALQAHVSGTLTVPQTPGRMLQAEASVQGQFGGPAAALALQGRLRDEEHQQGPQLQMQALLHPHQTTVLSTLQAQLQEIDLAALWPGAPQTRIRGQLQAQPDAEGWRLQVQLDNGVTGPWDQGRVPLQQLNAELLQSPQGWRMPALQARWPGGGMQGSGQWDTQATRGEWQIERLQAGQWLSTLSGPALSGQVRLQQPASGAVDLQARLTPQEGRLSAERSTSGLDLQLQWQNLRWRLDRLQLDWAGAHLQAQGLWSPADQQLQGQLEGRLPGLNARLEGELSPKHGHGQWSLNGAQPEQLWTWLQRWPSLQASLQGIRPPEQLQAEGRWQGGWAGPGLQLQARITTPRWRLQSRGALGRTAAPDQMWQGQIEQLQLEGATSAAPAPDMALVLTRPLAWQWHAPSNAWHWQAHRWALQAAGHSAGIAVEVGDFQPAQASRIEHRTGSRMHLQARVRDLPAVWASRLGLPALQGDLLLQGGLTLALESRPRLKAWLERQSGDLQLAAERAQLPLLQAGLRHATAHWQINDEDTRLDLNWDSAQAGVLQAQVFSRLNLAAEGLAGMWPQTAPLSGQLRAQLPRVGAWSWLAPPGWRVQGTLEAEVQLGGTRGQPEWTGLLQADKLAVRSAVEGVEFGQGRLRARLQGQTLRLEEFRLSGAGQQGGELSAQGQVDWLQGAGDGLEAVRIDLQMQARGLRVTRRADRRLSVSGDVRARIDRGQMQLRGRLQADSALFILPDDSTPTLGSDVRVIASAANRSGPDPTPSVSLMGVPDVQVELDLGPDFQLRGQGITTRLAGQVQLSSHARTAGQPRLVGQVRTEGGRYKAYGQQLEISQGLLRFTGPYDNPALDILALRPNLPQPVGVRVTGSASAPRIRLYAEPDMPDADKLAWLVLGRSPAAGGGESAVLQQAALALLGGNGKGLGGELASALGFDDLSLASRSTTTASGTTATGTAVIVGKRLSRDFYLAYESSISGAFGKLFIFYDLSRKLALRAQTGEINALDLIYTVRHD